MKKKAISSLYKQALQASQEELERAAALEALRGYGSLELTLGELVDGLEKDWAPFAKLTLADVFEAIGERPTRRRKAGRRRARKAARKAAPPASGGKKPPRRLTRAVSAKYTADIVEYLQGHPGAKAADIARAVGLLTRQAAALLKKMRASKMVTTSGKRAGMIYQLASGATAAPKKAAPKKAAPKKAAPKKAAPKKAAAKKATAPKKPVPPKRRAKKKSASKK